MIRSSVLRNRIFAMLMWAVCLYAIIRGGRSERFAGWVFLLSVEISVFVLKPISRRWDGLETAVFLVDVIDLVLFVALALRSSRFWPLGLAALQLCEVLSHLMLLALPGLGRLMYYNAVQLWNWPILVLIGIATWRYDRREPF